MQRKDYLLHLIGEMTNFILANNPTRMVLSLHQEEDGLHLCILDNHPRTDDELAAIVTALNRPDRPELAAYYGNLAGLEPLGKARLNLIGWQIKHADAVRSERGIKIDLWLGGKRFEPTRFTMPEKPRNK